MTKNSEDNVRQMVNSVYRQESSRILATLIRLLGDFDLAEDAMQDAFATALAAWPTDGVPANPRAWLISTGRFKAIDALHRRARFNSSQEKLAEELENQATELTNQDDETLQDDRLRLVFVCCHPALPQEARVALTLREVCGLTTEEIARAFLTSAPTVAQRVVRAKAKIRDARIPYQVPSSTELAERLDAVLQVVYLVFNEGYAASSGASLVRAELSGEAIRLGRLLYALLPEPEVVGLLALMLLQESRRMARTSDSGEIILLEHQDRRLWNRDQIKEGVGLVEHALRSRRFGPYTLQAAIAAVHSEAATTAETDWPQIVALYSVLARAEPSPVIELNRAVAVAMRDGPDAGLKIIDAILTRGELADYHLAHSARADLLRRLGRNAEAAASYQKALELTQLEPERRFLEKRIRGVKLKKTSERVSNSSLTNRQGVERTIQTNKQVKNTMRFLMMMIPRVYQPGTPEGERAGEGFTPPPEAIAKMMKYNEALTQAGALLTLDGLHPLTKGARVSFASGKPKVTDGPFIEAKEVLGGFWMIQVRTKEEAVEWARRVPAAEGDIIELRQVFEMSDFPPEAQQAADNPKVKAHLGQKKS